MLIINYDYYYLGFYLNLFFNLNIIDMLLPESPSPVHDQAVVLSTRQNPIIDPETQRRKDIEEFRLNLPITSYKEEIERLLDDQTFIIVTGETGSGKSTQLPQYVMDS